MKPLELPKNLSPEVEITDCGGQVTEMLSMLMTKMVIHGVPLNKRECDAIMAAMLISSASHEASKMDGRISREYDLNITIKARDSAGWYLATEHLSKVWFDCITRQQLVLVSCGQLALMDGLWCYGAISFEKYQKREPSIVTFFPVVEFHTALDDKGAERFTFTGKYITAPGGPELA